MVLSALIGLALLAIGGDILVRGAVGSAKALGVSPLVSGMIIVGFGTSMPELVTSVNAAAAGAPGITLGNVIGSNIANIMLILGVTALISPIRIDPKAFKRDAPMLAGATLVALTFVLSGAIGRATGVLFLILLIVYIGYAYTTERRVSDEAAAHYSQMVTLAEPAAPKLWINLAMALAGMVSIIFGANLLVGAAIVIGAQLGVPQAVIGLTVVAVGTSLPELAASAAAALRKQADVAFGNILGSNLFNLLGILGVTALTKPISVPPGVVQYDAWIMAAATVLMLVFAFTGRTLTRREGGTFLILYGAYLAFLVFRSTGAIA